MSKPHGEPEFYYRPNHVNGDKFRENFDRIFRKKDHIVAACDPAYGDNQHVVGLFRKHEDGTVTHLRSEVCEGETAEEVAKRLGEKFFEKGQMDGQQ